MSNPTYGKVVIEQGYKGGEVIHTHRTVHESMPITNRQQLIDIIFDQLSHLTDCKSISFQVFASKHSHEPIRVIIISEAGDFA